MKGTLVDSLVEAQPTYIFGVPRVWEKFQEKITKTVSESSSIRQKIFSWAQRTGLEAGIESMNKGFVLFAIRTSLRVNDQVLHM